jgi:AcrR family transcriptional regulator
METRHMLVQAAGDLFRSQGFAETTTRDIAKKARLASGTMFNYYRSKEELALALVVDLLGQAHAEFVATRRLAGTLDEWLFTLVATELRHLHPTRGYLKDILDGVRHPSAEEETTGHAVRQSHLKQVHEVLGNFGIDVQAGVHGWEHLYWSLYLGILTFWSADTSPKQEATMALLDRAVGMFLSLVRNWPRDE